MVTLEEARPWSMPKPRLGGSLLVRMLIGLRRGFSVGMGEVLIIWGLSASAVGLMVVRVPVVGPREGGQRLWRLRPCRG